MVTAEELVVAIKSDGVGETREDLEGVEGAMEDTAESAGDAAEDLEGFSQRFQGAMAAAVAGLAVGVGGLLSTIPVASEAMAGLFAVFDALGFQIDQLARQLGAGGLAASLFDLANAIYELDGIAGDLAGVLGIVATALLSALAATAAWYVRVVGLKTAVVQLFGAIKSLVAFITGLVSSAMAAAAAFGAFLGLLGVAVLEITGVLDAVRNLGQMIGTRLPAWARDGFLAFLAAAVGPLAVLGAAITGFVSGFLDGGLSEGIDRAVQNAKRVLEIFVGAWMRTFGRIETGISDFVSGSRSELSGFGEWLTDWAGGLADDAFGWGVEIVDQLIDGIRSMLDRLKDDLQELRDIAPGVSIDMPNIGGGGGGGGGGTGGGGGLVGTAAAVGRTLTGGSGGGGTYLDGRDVTERTGRYRTDPSRRQGL